jgi:lysozyme family protein
MLNLADNTSAVSDAVILAACARDAGQLIGAICDERLRFLKSLKTWSVFGKGWGRRVAEVRAAALAMAEKEA